MRETRNIAIVVLDYRLHMTLFARCEQLEAFWYRSNVIRVYLLYPLPQMHQHRHKLGDGEQTHKFTLLLFGRANQGSTLFGKFQKR